MKVTMKANTDLRRRHPIQKNQYETDQFDGEIYSHIELNEELESEPREGDLCDVKNRKRKVYYTG